MKLRQTNAITPTPTVIIFELLQQTYHMLIEYLSKVLISNKLPNKEIIMVVKRSFPIFYSRSNIKKKGYNLNIARKIYINSLMGNSH
jgi:hypothetical protein